MPSCPAPGDPDDAAKALQLALVSEVPLGRFGLSGGHATMQMGFLSGGQKKSRVAFALLTGTAPALIVLDEPMNHLDVETVDALIDAIAAYSGALLVVSHDWYFLGRVATEYWGVAAGRVTVHHGAVAATIAVRKSKYQCSWKAPSSPNLALVRRSGRRRRS